MWAPAPPTERIYLHIDDAIPPGAAGMEVVRVTGPTDRALRPLARAVGAVRLPVLELRGADGPVYIVGPEAVAKSLASRSPRR